MEKLGYFFLLCGRQGNYKNSLLKTKKKNIITFIHQRFLCAAEERKGCYQV